MAFQLIPMPISILFALVFAVAVMVILWKMRRRNKFFRYLFYAVAVFVVVLAASMVWMSLFPTPIGPGSVEVTVITDKTSYTLGEKVHINVQVNNKNDWIVPAPSKILYRFISDQTNRGFSDAYSYPDLAPHYVSNYQLNDHNFFNQLGNYTIAVTLYGDFDYSPTKEAKITINSS
jgi:hypothetical protein